MESELLPASQDARDAAADAMDAGYISPAGVIAHVRAGRSDENAFVQAFVRYGIHSRTITKEQVEEAARELARRNDLTFDTVWEKMSETDRDSFRDDALATASAFGLTVQSSDR